MTNIIPRLTHTHTAINAPLGDAPFAQTTTSISKKAKRCTHGQQRTAEEETRQNAANPKAILTTNQRAKKSADQNKDLKTWSR